MNKFFENLYQIGIVPVIKINNANQAVDLAHALRRGGLPVAEITFRSEAAEDAIRAIAQNAPDVCVCAGTVLTVENAERAANAGAKAIISPGTNPEVVKWCLAHGIPVIPGCATPTEIEYCIRLGLDMVKLFPAEVVGGVKMLKTLLGPYSNMKFMPTGGVSPANVGEYLAQPNVVACGGSWIAPENLLDGGEFDKIESLAREAVHLVVRR